MLLYLILQLIYGVIAIVTSPLLLLNLIPNFSVTAGTLPFGTDDILITAVSSFKAVMLIFPPFQVVYTAAMLLLGFEGIMFILRLILGHRLKDHQIE